MTKYEEQSGKLKNKEDNNIHLYGISYSDNKKSNLKVRKEKTSSLTNNDAITIIYDKS